MKQITTKFDKCIDCPHFKSRPGLCSECKKMNDKQWFSKKVNILTQIHPDCPLDDVVDSKEPLAYLSRAKLQLEFMRNLEREVMKIFTI